MDAMNSVFDSLEYQDIMCGKKIPGANSIPLKLLEGMATVISRGTDGAVSPADCVEAAALAALVLGAKFQGEGVARNDGFFDDEKTQKHRNTGSPPHKFSKIITTQDKAIRAQSEEIEMQKCHIVALEARFDAQSRSNARKDDRVRALTNMVSSLEQAAIRNDEKIGELERNLSAADDILRKFGVVVTDR